MWHVHFTNGRATENLKTNIPRKRLTPSFHPPSASRVQSLSLPSPLTFTMSSNAGLRTGWAPPHKLISPPIPPFSQQPLPPHPPPSPIRHSWGLSVHTSGLSTVQRRRRDKQWSGGQVLAAHQSIAVLTVPLSWVSCLCHKLHSSFFCLSFCLFFVSRLRHRFHSLFYSCFSCLRHRLHRLSLIRVFHVCVTHFTQPLSTVFHFSVTHFTQPLSTVFDFCVTHFTQPLSAVFHFCVTHFTQPLSTVFHFSVTHCTQTLSAVFHFCVTHFTQPLSTVFHFCVTHFTQPLSTVFHLCVTHFTQPLSTVFHFCVIHFTTPLSHASCLPHRPHSLFNLRFISASQTT